MPPRVAPKKHHRVLRGFTQQFEDTEVEAHVHKIEDELSAEVPLDDICSSEDDEAAVVPLVTKAWEDPDNENQNFRRSSWVAVAPAGRKYEVAALTREGGTEETALSLLPSLLPNSKTGDELALPPEDGFSLIRVSNDDLQEAALRGDLGFVRRLIHAGASVNAPMRPECDDVFMTLLHVLAMKPEMPNGTRIIGEVCRVRANLNCRSSTGSTPLMCACYSKHVGAVEALLDYKADLSLFDDDAHTALHCAASLERRFNGIEEASVEIVNLLAAADANVDAGLGVEKEISPMAEAVLRGNGAAVDALIAQGATPDGLHEAVQHATMEIILSLVKSEANPFLRNHEGKTVMDVALARGEEEVLTLLRDFIGDLQRQQHPHLKAMTASSANDDNYPIFLLNGDRGNNGRRTLATAYGIEIPEDSKVLLHLRRVQSFCRRLLRNKGFSTIMIVLLCFALVLPDVWVLFDIENSRVLDVMLICLMCTFTIEIIVQVVGLWRNYVNSFFFWMDLLGVLSLPLDTSVIVEMIPTSLDNAVLMRAARVAKLGARAGRFTRLLKLLRFLPGVQIHVSVGTAKVISNTLNKALGIRVASLIIIMVMVIPMFDLLTFPENDFSMKFWVNSIQYTADRYSQVDLESKLVAFGEFYARQPYFPFEVVVFNSSSGAETTHRLDGAVPVRQGNWLQVSADNGRSYAWFNFGSPNRVDALCNCFLMVMVVALMTGSALILSTSVSAIVLQPLETLLGSVQNAASSIFSSVTTMAGKIDAKNETDSEGSRDGGPRESVFGNETQLLERVLNRIQTLSEISVKRLPIDNEALEKLSETDRAVLEGYASGPDMPLMADKDFFDRAESVNVDGEELVEALEKHLADADLAWDSLESWDFNVMDLTDQQRQTVCLCCLMFHRGAVSAGGASNSEMLGHYTNFIDTVSRCYWNSKTVPYHGWVHAVDVAFTAFRFLNMISAEHFLGSFERFSLIVSAICIDIGHPGFNNQFLVETGHDLAVRYNDHSPLENMHVAKLFEIASQPTTAIFTGLEKAQRKESRLICIEAILHTDYSRHLGMVKEVQMLYETNSELFDTSGEMYRAQQVEFPSKEVADFFKCTDAKKHIRNLVLHFCDVSNPMKHFQVAHRWAASIIDEFFMQGDRERELGMTVQPLNDRDRTNRAYSQIGFIEYFMSPFVFAAVKLMPPLELAADMMLGNFEAWSDEWADDPDNNVSEEDKAKLKDRAARLRDRYRTQCK